MYLTEIYELSSFFIASVLMIVLGGVLLTNLVLKRGRRDDIYSLLMIVFLVGSYALACSLENLIYGRCFFSLVFVVMVPIFIIWSLTQTDLKKRLDRKLMIISLIFLFLNFATMLTSVIVNNAIIDAIAFFSLITSVLCGYMFMTKYMIVHNKQVINKQVI